MGRAIVSLFERDSIGPQAVKRVIGPCDDFAVWERDGCGPQAVKGVIGRAAAVLCREG